MDNSVNSHIFKQVGPVVGLFAKEPVPGQVKTRLTPGLTEDQACRLYRVCLLETVERLQAGSLPLVICYSGRRDWFRQTFPDLPLLAQSGDGLGSRMSNAVQALFARAGRPVLLAGSDSPDLPLAMVDQVLEALQQADVATVPCHDGGYVVVGLRRPTTEVFADIPWSTSGVLAATRQRCRDLGLTYQQTAAWDDLDELDDLGRLVARSPETATARHIIAELHERLSIADGKPVDLRPALPDNQRIE